MFYINPAVFCNITVSKKTSCRLNWALQAPFQSFQGEGSRSILIVPISSIDARVLAKGSCNSIRRARSLAHRSRPRCHAAARAARSGPAFCRVCAARAARRREPGSRAGRRSTAGASLRQWILSEKAGAGATRAVHTGPPGEARTDWNGLARRLARRPGIAALNRAWWQTEGRAVLLRCAWWQ